MRITDHVYVLSGSYYTATDMRNLDRNGLLGEVYGIHTPQGIILVDCGLPGSGLAMIRETLAYYRLEERIVCLVVTHAHNDHCGSAKAIQDMGAQVIAGSGDAPACLNGGSGGWETPFDQEQLYPAFTPDILIDRDCEYNLYGLTLRFITIPGHTPGSIAIHLCLDHRTILFTGDSLLPYGSAILDEVSFGWRGDIGFSREALLTSMMKLRKLQVDIILPGHGKICLKDGTQLLNLAAKEAFSTLR
ncbi:MAG: MBL fold metallo-hydrolase [Treponema sp.]|jgi:glyoxylase-like metal-dependent hydrolase (beta-lactamase superfamily II)|nr:MBL fold metallo-hydrolase [Treponema sp.]